MRFVKDNGLGFKTNLVGTFKGAISGFGLFSIQERMNCHKGNFFIESNQGKATLAVLTAPISKAAP